MWEQKFPRCTICRFGKATLVVDVGKQKRQEEEEHYHV